MFEGDGPGLSADGGFNILERVGSSLVVAGAVVVGGCLGSALRYSSCMLFA